MSTWSMYVVEALVSMLAVWVVEKVKGQFVLVHSWECDGLDPSQSIWYKD